MKFIEQPIPLENKNYDTFCPVVKNRHGSWWPNTIRGIISGPSGCGKTNLVVNFINEPYGFRFENLYSYSTTFDQPKVDFIDRVFNPELRKHVQYFQFSNYEDVIPPQEARPNSLFTFDDVAQEKQEIIKKYYSRGRHSTIDSLYLAQSYAWIPKPYIRDNANLLILFKQDEKNLKHVYVEHVSGDMDFKEFLKFARICWRDEYGFLTIVKEFPLNKGRYRKVCTTYVKF